MAVVGRELVVFELRVSNRIDECIRFLCGSDGINLVVSARVLFAVGEENKRLPTSGHIAQLAICGREDGIVDSASTFACVVGVQLWKFATVFGKSFEAIDDGRPFEERSLTRRR